MLDIAPDHLAEVRRILGRHLSGREVRAFGSRVTGAAKPFSDLDLVVMGDAPLDFRQLSSLKDDFAESNLPFRVDLVDWAITGATFRTIIANANEIVLEGAAEQPAVTPPHS